MGKKKEKEIPVAPKKEIPVAPKADPEIKLNSKNQKTLKAIFERPARSDIPWSDIERLFEGLGGIVDSKRAGSRIGVSLRGVRAIFHEPHPSPATDKGAVASVRKFLLRCGIYHD
jgi:hypothetical protein